ncbi:protein kinase [bacterium]|nr:protein kinase [bacterium]
MRCPSLEEIAGILLEDDSSSRFRDFMTHLDTCRRCQRSLTDLSELPMDHDIGDIFTPTRKMVHSDDFESPSKPFGIMPDDKPTQLDHLIFETKIGEGGMAEVYKCFDEQLGRNVAVKVIDSSVMSSRNLVRLEQEARIHAKLKHPNVVSLLEFKVANGLPYLIMELVEGGTLKELFKTHTVNPRTLALILRDVALAVQAAHDLGILHRDLKPANILLEKRVKSGSSDSSSLFSGNSLVPKVSDFGLAKLADSNTDLSKSAMYLGTPAYMSPEQTMGDSSRIGPRADIYSLGVILYEGLTGRLPFVGDDLTELFGRIRHNLPVLPSEIQAGVPHDLETICLKCLEKDPRARYAKAADLAEELTRFLDGNPIYARPIGPLRQLVRWARRKPVLAASLVLLIAEVITFGIWNMRSAATEAEARVREAEARVKESVARAKAEQKADELQEDYENLKSQYSYAINLTHSNADELERIISKGSREQDLRKFKWKLRGQRGELAERMIPALDGDPAFDTLLAKAYYLSGVRKKRHGDHMAAAEQFRNSIDKARSHFASGKTSLDHRYYAMRSFNLLAESEIARGNYEAALKLLKEAWDNYASHGDDFELTRAAKVMSMQTAFRLIHCLEILGRFDETWRISTDLERIERVPVQNGEFDVDILY